ncbi:MAG: efflux RND transporter periplasmic adaptor subunit [Planctomycetes bacterium]|nr:efflux RND transporter periplasmic adaptor subunit [Planctomycetota bacterium]
MSEEQAPYFSAGVPIERIRTRSRWGWALVALAAGATAAWLWGREERDAAPAFRMERVERGEVVALVSASGEVRPVTLVQVGSQVSGRVSSLEADFNGHVAAGQVVCRLDPIALQAEVAQDEANLARAQARVRQVEANLDLARRELARSEALSTDGLVTPSELDRERAAAAALEAECSVALAEVAQSEAALGVSRANLDYATIRSPVDGIVVSRNVDVGQTVAASLSAPVLFEIAAGLDPVHVLAAVGEADIGRISLGKPVSFRVDAYPEATFEGEVLQIRLAPKVEQGVVSYTVVVRSANPEGKLLPGMTANVSFEAGRSPPDALRVPLAALRFEPEEEWTRGVDPLSEDGRRVWVREGGSLRAIPVAAGWSDGQRIEVSGEGLREGLEVVVGIEEAEDGSADLVNPFRPPSRSGRRR